MINLKVKKNPMPEQAPDIRNHNFEEVCRGIYSTDGYQRSDALSQLSGKAMYTWMSGHGPDPGIHCKDYRGRL